MIGREKILREQRQRAGLSQQQVAERLNISRQSVSKWERGMAYPDIDNLILLAGIYGTTLDELTGMVQSRESKIQEQRRDVLQEIEAEEKLREPVEIQTALLVVGVLLLSCLFPQAGILADALIFLFYKGKWKWGILFMTAMCLYLNVRELLFLLSELWN